MKYPILFLIIISAFFNVNAQSSKTSDSVITKQDILPIVHRIIFQLTTDDTMAHKSLMKQIKNITSVEPSTQIEVVCHGPGLNMLVADRTVVHNSIRKLTSSNITFVACEFSMKERNVSSDRIIKEASFVKAGIIEIVTRQEQGWSYIKSGF